MIKRLIDIFFSACGIILLLSVVAVVAIKETCPGLNGSAQVNGRDSLSWDERFKLDIWYVDNQSF